MTDLRPSPSLAAPNANANANLNSTSLPLRISIDVASAICAASLVAPVISLIDKSIILKTHSSESIQSILRTSFSTAFKHPLKHLRSPAHLLILFLYGSTYSAANLSDTVSSTLQNRSYSHVSAGPAKFLCTTMTNVTTCLYKDAQFTKMFGAASSPTRKVPLSTLLLFGTRDSLTIFASFNVPPLLGPMIGSRDAAQFIAPAGIQFLSTPLHLLGLDLYNRREGISASERWMRVTRDWFGASLARIGRIVPAFGVGGVVNGRVRRRLMEVLEG